MNRATWRSLSDANLAESHREFSRWHPDGEILERQGLLLTRGADRYPGVNFAMVTGEPRDPRLVVQRARDFFGARADGFAVRTRGHIDDDLIAACQQDELFIAGENVGLLRSEPISLDHAQQPIDLRMVTSLGDAEAFASVAVTAFATIGLPERTGEHIFHRPSAMLAPHLLPMLALVDGQPAATGLALFSHGIAGLYWVGTAPFARGRGLARQLTATIHNRALAMGARGVVLQANEQYAGFYQRLGYHAITRYPWYLTSHIV